MPAAENPAPQPQAHALADLLAELRTAVDRPELLDLPAVCRLTSQSKSSVYRAMSAGEFPKGLDTPSGRRWRRKDVMKWVERLK